MKIDFWQIFLKFGVPRKILVEKCVARQKSLYTPELEQCFSNLLDSQYINFIHFKSDLF